VQTDTTRIIHHQHELWPVQRKPVGVMLGLDVFCMVGSAVILECDFVLWLSVNNSQTKNHFIMLHLHGAMHTLVNQF